ncbi:MAG: hypothetical protein ACOYOO_14980, partial [Saprospiraceae bacterium]
MRKLLFLLFFLPALAFGQAPAFLSYQSVIRDANNNLLVNKDVTVRISIVKDSAASTVPVFREVHLVTTNQNGLVYLTIGKGDFTSGRLDTIQWSKGLYFIVSEVDPDGGNNFKISVATQILSVPFALNAASADKLTQEYPEKDPVFNVSVAKGITSADTAYWEQKLDPEDTLSLSNRINTKLNAADTVKYVKYADTTGLIGTKANLALKL